VAGPKEGMQKGSGGQSSGEGIERKRRGGGKKGGQTQKRSRELGQEKGKKQKKKGKREVMHSLPPDWKLARREKSAASSC